MKVHCGEGVAIHTGPESCGACREARVEALTGVRIGQPLSRDRSLSRVPTLFHLRKATRTGAFTPALARPGAVEPQSTYRAIDRAAPRDRLCQFVKRQ